MKAAARATEESAILNSITAPIVIIGEDGAIRESNRAWRSFVAARTSAGVGGISNYFDVCRWSMGTNDEQYEEIAAGLRQLFGGAPAVFESAFRAAGIAGEPLLVLRAYPMEDAVPRLAVLVHNEAAQIQKILVRKAESRVRGTLQSREFRSLERLGSSAEVKASEAVGLAPLRSSLPDEFLRLSEIYGDILELAMVHRTYKMTGSLSVRLRLLAEDLGCVDADPRDVIDVHRQAFTKRIHELTAGRAQMLLEEGRIVLLELMGYLASYYRNAQGCNRANGKADRGWPGEGAEQ